MADNPLAFKKAVSLDDALKGFLKEARLSSEHNCHRVEEAWKEASGASQYTIRTFYRAGILHVTLNSSVAKMHLQMQNAALVQKINQILEKDNLFIKDDPNVGFVKELKLK